MVTTLDLIELLLKYGPGMFSKIIRGLETDEPTEEQIADLKVKAPEEYFEE